MSSLLVLEPIGGIAGDMFLAAAIDLGVPAGDLEGALRTLGLPGWRLAVSRRAASGLPPRAKEKARALFQRIGEAEATVHGIPVAEVHFHEVGAVDSIVDLCGAAVALELLGWPRVLSAPPELDRKSVV